MNQPLIHSPSRETITSSPDTETCKSAKCVTTLPFYCFQVAILHSSDRGPQLNDTMSIEVRRALRIRALGPDSLASNSLVLSLSLADRGHVDESPRGNGESGITGIQDAIQSQLGSRDGNAPEQQRRQSPRKEPTRSERNTKLVARVLAASVISRVQT